MAESALYRAYIRRVRLHYSRIDLEGYEVRDGSLEQYVTYQLSRRSDDGQSRVKAVLNTMKLQLKLQGPSVWGVSLLSLVLNADMPIKELLQIMGSTFDSLPAGSRSPRERFSLLVRRMAAEKRLIVHVLDAAALTSPMQEWLLDEVATDVDLCLVFSAHTQDDLVLGVGPSMRIELPQLLDSEIRMMVGERFPNDFPQEIWRSLWAYSGGYAGRIALKMVDLLTADMIVENLDGTWRLREGVLNSEELVDVFGVDEMELLRLAIAGMPAPLREGVEQFVRLAALSGDAVLVRSIALLVGFPEDGLDSFVDAIDDGLQLPLFEDLGYTHPSFPGELVYRFYNPVARLALVQRIPLPKRAELADSLLRFLVSRQRIQTRGMARLYMELSRYCSDDLRDRLQRSLAWWISTDEAAELTVHIRRELANGKLNSMMVLREVRAHSRFDWPVYRSLAVLDALLPEYGNTDSG